MNFLVFLSPITFFMVGKYLLNITQNSSYIKSFLLLTISVTNFFTLLFLSFDFIFSFSIRKLTNKAIRYDKDKYYKSLDEIFKNVKNKFNVGNVELYVDKNSTVNAYAVGSLRKKAIILTTGLLNRYADGTKDRNDLMLKIEGILAHEMSHLVNNDYFTGLLLMVNERAVRFVSRLVLLVFNIFIKLFNFVPVVGQYIVISIVQIYKVFDFIIYFFYKYILLKVYDFIQLKLSRSIEYRADRQAGKMIGGKNMAGTLEVLGTKGYISIFSTHPLTKDRVKAVKNVEIADGKIKPVFLSREMFIITIILLLSLCYYPYKMADVDGIINDYTLLVLFFKNKYIMIKSYITMFLQR